MRRSKKSLSPTSSCCWSRSSVVVAASSSRTLSVLNTSTDTLITSNVGWRPSAHLSASQCLTLAPQSSLLSAFVCVQCTCCPRRLCRSASVKFSSPFVCLFVCPQHNSKNEWSQTVQTWYREWSWDTLEVVLFWGSKVKGQGHRVSKFISHTRTLHIRTAIHRHSLGGVTSRRWDRTRDQVLSSLSYHCLHCNELFERWRQINERMHKVIN